MSSDPKGYYARLEVATWARREAIHAAYRRKARLLHPDIPGTGNAEAFVAMKEAYEVLSDPLRRAAYDRQAKAGARPARPAPPPRARTVDEAEEILPDPPPPMPPVKLRHPRFSDLPWMLWLGLGGAAILAGFEAVLHLTAAPPPNVAAAVPATAPYVAPASPPPPPAPVDLAGRPNAYVLPAGGAAVVWRHDDQRHAFLPIGQLPPFSAVEVVRVLPQNGLVEVRLAANAVGFIEASRLTPGSAEAAHQAYCAYNAGPLPSNAEVLQRSGSGTAAVTLVNHSGQPAVVKLRTAQGAVAATVYLAPNGVAHVAGLPGGAYQPEYAIGELWSRGCNSFAAGMRAQRLAAAADISTFSTLDIPPDISAGPMPVDIPDKVFNSP